MCEALMQRLHRTKKGYTDEAISNNDANHTGDRLAMHEATDGQQHPPLLSQQDSAQVVL